MKRLLVKWHNALGWWALTGIVIWGASAIAHPVMSWFGPQSVNFFPPRMVLSPDKLPVLSASIMQADVVDGAKIIKVVAGKTGPLLQITRDEQRPREYFDLSTESYLHDHDAKQAEWLAAYYTDLPTADIEEVYFQTAFSEDYPSVNRLIPVYRIRFGDSEQTTAYIYTETAALASLSNQFKRNVQWVFQNLHTFSWLDRFEFGRVIVIVLWMLCLAATAIVGFALVIALKSRKIKDKNRRYHRWFAYVLWLPLLGWSSSGFYHILQSSFVSTTLGVRLASAIPTHESTSFGENHLSELSQFSINALSLVYSENDQLYWRASVSPLLSEAPSSREQRFSGKPMEQKSMYIPVQKNAGDMIVSDQHFVVALAKRYAGVGDEGIGAVTRVTSFGPNYDFRNKRLPVWRVEINDGAGTWIFVDPRTGVLVDQSRSIDRAERWSFSLLHKWNHLTPFMGRQLRDVIIVITLVMIVLISAFGAALLVKRQRKKRKQVTSDAVLLAD
ncbi:MAG: hypothetical protein K6L81_15350 [Agarilytica sp.]